MRIFDALVLPFFKKIRKATIERSQLFLINIAIVTNIQQNQMNER